MSNVGKWLGGGGRASEVVGQRGGHGRPRAADVFAAVRHHRNFRLFWFGQIISVSGTWMQNIGQAWLVLQLSHSAFLLGLVSALQFLPLLVFSLFGGVIADKLPKHKVLLGTQSAAMIQAFILFVLAATGVVQVWHIMVLAFCLGLVNALDMPTRQAFISEMVTRDDLMNAISLNSAQFNASRVVGPGIAAALIALLGIPALFLLNSISYVAVLVGLSLMDPAQLHAPVARARQSERPLRQIREGVSFSWRSPVIRLALLLVFVISTFGMNFNIVLPLFADSVYRSGAPGFGLLSSVLGLGSLAAALVIAGTVKQPRVRLMVASGMAFSLLEIVLSFTRSQLAAYPALLLVGFSTIAFSATANTLLQSNSPDYMRGRVMSLYAMVFAGSTPIGALITGWLAAAYGAPMAVMLCALPGVGMATYGWLVASKVRTAPVGGQRAAASEAGTVVPPVSSPPARAAAPLISADTEDAHAAKAPDAPDTSTPPAGASDGNASDGNASDGNASDGNASDGGTHEPLLAHRAV